MEIDPTRLEEIFNAALGQADAAARAAYLDQACGDDRPLRQRVEALLAAHLTANNFLNLPGSQIGNTAIQPVSERPGSQIGPYKLLQQLGEGGMGVVYMAEQKQPVERRVALKIIKPGMDSRQVIARFEAERQALALMDHPHIAKVLDAGTTETGRPYFVMEMVRGVAITEYCDQHQLTPRQRLELFVPVCHAVQHAHQKGIIHRDLKPSNVLVAEYDEQPVAKIIDFGVAKAVGQQLTEKTMFTQVGQLVGTIDYMSPEQAKVNQLDVDTRTDIYSLGVLLYELLTGETPFDRDRLHAAALDEMLRIIREEEPPRPSTRLSSSATLPSAAAKRHTEPNKLTTLVRGELDWIVMRCLEKDRTRRYESANGLGMDIQRYLADEPVLACPPSAAYRFSKFTRRNRVAMLTVAIVSVALIVGTVVSLWQAVRATRAEHLADQRLSAETHARAAEAEQRKAAEAQRHEAENQRELAEANYQKAKAAVDRYFTLVSESNLLDVPGLQPLRKDLLEAALEFYQGAALERSSDPAVLVDEALAHLRVGSMYFALGQVDDFIGALERAMDVVDRVGSRQSQFDDHLRRLAGWFKGSRQVWHQTDRPRDPLRAYQTVLRYLATWQRFELQYANETGFSSDLLAGYGLMAAGLNSAGRKNEGLEYLRKARATGEQLVARFPEVPLYRATLAEVSLSMASPYLPNQVDERMSWSRRALELTEGLVAEFPDVPVYRDGLADSLRRVHDQIAKAEPRQAEELARRALDLRESLVREFPGERYFWESWRRERIAWATFEASRGNDSLANQHVQQAIETFEAQIKIRPQDRWLRVSLAIFCQTLAAALPRPGDLTELAEQLDRRAIAISTKLAAEFPGDQKFVMDLIDLHETAAGILWPMGRVDDAAQHFKACVAVMEQAGRQPGPLYNIERFCGRTIDLARIIASGARDPEPADTSRLLVRATELLDEGLQDPVRRSFLAAAIRAYCEPLSKDQPVLPEVDKLLTWSNPIVEQTIDNRPTLNKLIADHTADKWDRNRAAETQKLLAKILAWTNRPMEAGEMWLRAIRSYQAIANDVPDQRIYVQYVLQDYRQYLGVRVEQLVKNGKPDEAVKLLRKSIDTLDNLTAEHPKSDDLNRAFQADTLSQLAWTLDRSGHAHDAAAAAKRNVDIYQALFRNHPDNEEYRRGMARAAVGLARLLNRAGKLDEAEAQLRILISVAPQQLEIYQGLADLLAKQDRIEEAKAVIHTASEQASADALSKNNLAWFLATSELDEIRDPALAVKIVQRVVEMEPQSPQYLNTLGVAQYRAGEWQESIRSLATAEELTPGQTLAFNGFFLAMAHWQLGHHDEARKWYERSVDWMAKNQPKNKELVRFRAEAEELLGLVPPGDAPKAAPQVDMAKPPG